VSLLNYSYPVFFIFFLSTAGAASADSIKLYPDRDATLIEHPHGELANGAGPALFVGRTKQSSNGVRRALLHFDVGGMLPGNAIIKDVSLTLHLTKSNPRTVDISAHRVLDDWREGLSSSSGGGGAIAQSGDTTWLHTNFDVHYWKRIGGHFVARASATSVVGASDKYIWADSKKLLADVRLWLHAPQRNFGWLLKGDENTVQSVKRFDSRETSTPDNRPVLTIHYTRPGKHRCSDSAS